jgi:hypothetical protein
MRLLSNAICRKNTLTLRASASVAGGCRLMREHRIGAVPMTDRESPSTASAKSGHSVIGGEGLCALRADLFSRAELRCTTAHWLPASPGQ